MAPVMPMAAPVQQDRAGKKGNRLAGVLKFMPSVMLIVFAVVCFFCFLGAGYSYTVNSYTTSVPFYNSIMMRDMLDETFSTEGGSYLWIAGIVLIVLAVVSLIIGASGFGKAAASKAGQAWTKKYRKTFKWGVAMYLLVIIFAAVYCVLVIKRPDFQFADARTVPDTAIGITPILLMVFSAVGIIGSIVISVIKGSAAKTYGNLDKLQAARELKHPATHGVRTGFFWTITGKSLLFFIFAVLLFVFFALTLVEDYGLGDGGSLYALLSDETYELKTAMWALLISAAICAVFGFISLMRDLGARKRIANATEQDKGAVKFSLFFLFLYVLVLGCIGYTYSQLDATGLTALNDLFGGTILGPMMTALTALTSACLAVHIILLILQCAVYNTFDFDGTSAAMAAMPPMPAGYAPYPYPPMAPYPPIPPQGPYAGYAPMPQAPYAAPPQGSSLQQTPAAPAQQTAAPAAQAPSQTDQDAATAQPSQPNNRYVPPSAQQNMPKVKSLSPYMDNDDDPSGGYYTYK